MSETITIEGNFTIKGVGGLKSIKQPLKYLELEIAFPLIIKPVRVQASENPIVEEELKVGDNVHIKQSDFGTLIIKKLGDIWVECEAGGLIRILVKREDLAKEVNNKSDFMQASGGIKKGTLKPIEPKVCSNCGSRETFCDTKLPNNSWYSCQKCGYTWGESNPEPLENMSFKEVMLKEDNKTGISEEDKQVKLEKIIDKLYNLNADISLYFIAMRKVPKTEDLVSINKSLAEIIKELKEVKP